MKEKIHWVRFSSVEDYFYRRQQESCISNMSEVLDTTNPDRSLSSFQHSTLVEVLDTSNV